MKVALCYSGLVRNFHDCLSSHKNFIIDRYKPDIFIHTWSKIGSNTLPHWYTEEYSLEKHIDETEKQNNIDAKSIIDILQPKKFLIEYPDILYFYNKFYSDNYNFFNNVMMHYSINKSNNLKKEYENNYSSKYDMVIRCRFDSYFENLEIKNYLKNTIYLPPSQNMDVQFSKEMLESLERLGPVYMTNDQFAYGCSESIDYYSAVIDYMIKDINYYTKHPEGVLAEHLWLKNNSQYKNIQINDTILMRIQSRYWKSDTET